MRSAPQLHGLWRITSLCKGSLECLCRAVHRSSICSARILSSISRTPKCKWCFCDWQMIRYEGTMNLLLTDMHARTLLCFICFAILQCTPCAVKINDQITRLPNGLIKVGLRWWQRHPQGAKLRSTGTCKVSVQESHTGCHQPSFDPVLPNICQPSPFRPAVARPMDPVNNKPSR